MASDIGIVQANPAVSLFDLAKRGWNAGAGITVPGGIANVAGRMAGGESLPVAIGGAARGTMNNIFGVARDAAGMIGDFAGGVKQGFIGDGTPAQPQTVLAKPVAKPVVAPVSPVSPVATAPVVATDQVVASAPAPAPVAAVSPVTTTPAPSTTAPAAPTRPGNNIFAYSYRPTGSMSGLPGGAQPANVQPVQTSAIDIPSLGVRSLLSPTVQNDVLGVDRAADLGGGGTNIIARESPGEKRWAFNPNGGVISGTPSSVVAYPQGTGPTRAKPLTESQIATNKNIFGKYMGDDAILKQTPLEKETLARYRGTNYNPALGMQRPDVRRSVLANEQADMARTRGDTMADKDVVRKKTLFQAQGDIARGIEQEKGKTAIAAGEAQERIRQAAMTERERQIQMGITGRADRADQKQEAKVDADRVNMGLKQVAAGRNDEALELLVPQYTAMVASGKKPDADVATFVQTELARRANKLLPAGTPAQLQNLVRALAKVNGQEEALSPEVKAKFGLK